MAAREIRGGNAQVLPGGDRMITRLVIIVTATCLLGSTPGQGQVVLPECSAPSAPEALRIALIITDLNDVPFSGIGHVSIRGKTPAPSRQEEVRPGFLEYWYCSDELPRGKYTVEVRTLTFDCTAISIAGSETGLVVRLIRLRPDPWRSSERARSRFSFAFDPQMSAVERLGAKRCGVSPG